ncbi:MAG: 16S rRNA (adenine(1518)-N(6)/adenine(1519)-N(6))-dimethyltransferase RsmA [Desulfurococcales archaeon]|nr:16S rRNA (adenine(1518)-N(6)/adenine(1519)-N(6))-dimethyltransferase RsmA [Desulfurococcales archaeon]
MNTQPCPPVGLGKSALLSWLKGLLSSHGLKALDRLGQNFLVDPRGVEAFARQAEELAMSPLLEVGPGACILTYRLYRVTPRLAAVEIDHGLAWACSAVAAECMPAATILRGDGVQAAQAWRAPLIVSNTPYNITTRLIAGAARNNSVKAMILGMQLEVARRILAEPGTADYGRITILARRYFRARMVAVLPRSYYYPQPRVNGAIVTLERTRKWSSGDEVLEEVAKCLFTGRRRLASKMARECSRRLGIELCSRGLGDKRVYQLYPEDVEEMVKCGN